MIFLFICPFLAMRLVAEEKRNKTFELLMTTPHRPIEIMLGKYLAALVLMLVAVGLLGLFPFLVVELLRQLGHDDERRGRRQRAGLAHGASRPPRACSWSARP